MRECLFIFLKGQNVSLSNYHQDMVVITYLNTFLVENVSKKKMFEKNQILLLK